MLEERSTVIVLDDNPEILEHCSEIFQAERKLKGITFDSPDGFEECVLEEVPHLVVVSSHLKGDNGERVRKGHKLVRKLQKHRELKNTVFVVLTDEEFTFFGFLKESFIQDCDSIWFKPLDKDRFKDKLVGYASAASLKRQMENQKLLNFNIRKTCKNGLI